MTTRLRSQALPAVLLLAAAPVGLAGGVPEHESGSIQTDAVGQSIWAANAVSHSVSHIDAASTTGLARSLRFSACAP